MDIAFIVPVLALLTLLGGCVFALVNKQAIEARRDDPSAPKSTLAADKSAHGKPADV